MTEAVIYMEGRDVAVVGVGQTEFGEHEETSLVDLFGDAYEEAVDDAGIGDDAAYDMEDIDALYYGNLGGERSDDVSNMPAHIVDELGLEPMPGVRYEGACASSSVAFHEAYKDVKHGEHDLVVVGGSERLKSIDTAEGTAILGTATLEDKSFPEVFATAVEHYADHYDVAMDELHEAMAEVAVKNHEYGAENPKAQFYQQLGDLDREDVLDADTVADPLTLLECCPMTDGGSAVILAADDVAQELDAEAVGVEGTGLAVGGTMREYGEEAIEAYARQEAASQAYGEAGIEPDAVDFVELHDCFSIAEIIATEALGFHDHGDGYEAAADGATRLDGDLPVNPSGGLIGKGHPVGATGTAQVYSAVKTLRGGYDHLDDLDDAETALVDTLGGDFGTVADIVLQYDGET